MNLSEPNFSRTENSLRQKKGCIKVYLLFCKMVFLIWFFSSLEQQYVRKNDGGNSMRGVNANDYNTI